MTEKNEEKQKNIYYSDHPNWKKKSERARFGHCNDEFLLDGLIVFYCQLEENLVHKTHRSKRGGQTHHIKVTWEND